MRRTCQGGQVHFAVLLVQPSSAGAERAFFFLLSNSFGCRQDNSLQDYIEASLMLQYNNH